jgi:hypothetical protein
MPALHALAARRTRPDVDTEFADHGPDHRQIFLVLRDHARALHVAATRGTRVGQRRLVRLVDPPGHEPRAMAPVAHTDTSAGPTPGALSMGFREGGGLPEAGPTRSVELILESLVAPLQSLPLALRTRQRIATAQSPLAVA